MGILRKIHIHFQRTFTELYEPPALCKVTYYCSYETYSYFKFTEKFSISTAYQNHVGNLCPKSTSDQ